MYFESQENVYVLLSLIRCFITFKDLLGLRNQNIHVNAYITIILEIENVATSKIINSNHMNSIFPTTRRHLYVLSVCIKTFLIDYYILHHACKIRCRKWFVRLKGNYTMLSSFKVLLITKPQIIFNLTCCDILIH